MNGAFKSWLMRQSFAVRIPCWIRRYHCDNPCIDCEKWNPAGDQNEEMP